MNILDEIVSGKKPRAVRSMTDAIKSSAGMGLIAEIKRKSPSRGSIREVDPVDAAHLMAEAGADAISVLTNKQYFGGSLDDLKAVSGAVGVPVIRKDFITEFRELYEAVAYGADAVLLICALLEDRTKEFVTEAGRIGLECLVEVHDEGELEHALSSGAQLIGVNNRDLSTLKVDLATCEAILPLIPEDRIKVAESGVHTPEDALRMKDAGADAILVGTSVMEAADIGAKVGGLKDACV
ncbi:indole-3-glycerol-phosphate synthase [Candidatus Altiarchaeota archaeon]